MTIIAEVAANYYQLCALDQELSIVQQTLDARREGVRLAKLRYEGGLTSETAYNQAQVELARTETFDPLAGASDQDQGKRPQHVVGRVYG